VQFPAKLTTISRHHAELIREGNRYKLIDRSANGTFVNGKKITEAFLKDGDVIMLAEGGPKASFLAKITDAVQVEKAPAADPIPAPPSGPVQPPPVERVAPPVPPVDSFIPVKEAAAPPPTQPRQPVPTVQAPLIVQFGPTLRSYKELPVIIGKKADCGFVLNHPAIADAHAQIFFNANQYWVRDLTGRNSISINGAPVGFEAALKPQDIISLVQNGPAFRFLGEGRLAEHEEEEQAPSAPAEKSKPALAGDEKKEKSFFKGFFKK
jgi:pSer/pThr/pTyr-binding forkhead associated (FHA) protein